MQVSMKEKKNYERPQAEVEEIFFESAVLDSSGSFGSTLQNLEEEDYTW